MSFHTARSTLARLHSRVICYEVSVIVVSKVKLHKLCKLSKGWRHMSMESEFTEVDQCHSSVRMKRYARLVAPEVRILVEVPVASARMILADIIPLRTVKRLPYFIKSIIVLDVLVAFVKLHRYVSICNLVILYCKHSLRYVRGNLEKSLSVVIHRVRNNLVLTGSEGKKSITCTRRCLIAISRIIVLKEMNVKACRQHLELGSRIACLD